MKIQLLLTGNELMSGHTVDSNSAMIAEQLADFGFKVDKKVTIGDDFELLVNEIKQLSLSSDLLFINGGLGPTIDDLTAEALATAIEQPLQNHQQAIDHLNNWCAKRKLPMNAPNLKQAYLPTGVNIIDNPIGSAVGFSIMHNNCLVICTPGVPSELKAMMEGSINELIKHSFPDNQPTITQRFQTFGLGESSIQQVVDSEISDWPEEVELGYRAGLPLLEIKLSIKKSEHKSIQQKCYQQLNSHIGDCIIGQENATLASTIINLLEKANKTITTAESCTGGLIAANITEISGASTVFEAGYVTYSNTMKINMLGVEADILETEGAVSEKTVLAMANGALNFSNADYTIAVSGVAGPNGGTDEKPVGTVWIAWGKKNNLKTFKFRFNASRKWFQQMVTATALDLIRRELAGINTEPHYFKRHRQ